MQRRLTFIHNWIGPTGPLPNHKIPDIYDLMKKMPFTKWDYHTSTDEHDPIVQDIKSHVPCKVIPAYDIESIGNEKFLFELTLSPKLHYTELEFSESFGVLDVVPTAQSILEAVREKNGYFLITSRYESFFDDKSLLNIHRYFISKNIPLNKVIYLTNCANATEIYDSFCLRHNFTEKMVCEYIGLYVLMQKKILNDPVYEQRVDNLNKDKIFLNFNRRHRTHRYLLLLNFYYTGLLEQSLMSFSRDITAEQWHYDVSKVVKQFNLGISSDEIYRVYDSLPLVLDSHDFTRFPVEDELRDTALLYDRTWIHLASETNFESNIVHLTEKTIKPILFKQPFITIGPANTLHYLHELGFQTFGDYWDESYDRELNCKKRFAKIMEICNFISKQNLKWFKRLYKETAERRNHNLRVLKHLQPTHLNKFLANYGNWSKI